MARYLALLLAVLAIGVLPMQALATEADTSVDSSAVSDLETVDEAEAEAPSGETDAEEADAEEADIEEADIEETDIEEADTEEADTEEANTEEADAEEADLEKTDASFYIKRIVFGSGLARSFKVNTTTYNTLQDAVTAAIADGGGTIYITEDCDLSAPVTISSSSALTITFAADTASGSVTITSESDRHMKISGTGDITLSFDGVTLSGGNAGGGIAFTGTSLTLNDAYITNCYSNSNGGGFFASSGWGTLTINNSTISGNTADYGGGIYGLFSYLNINGSTISGNTADCGGGIYGLFSYLNINGSAISGNTADYGGGIFSGGATTITASTISGNTAFGDGGGIYSGGSTTITASTISDNTATDGGGIYNHDLSEITDSTISGNTATGDGGGIYNYGSSEITTSMITYNTATGDGGAIYTSDLNNLTVDEDTRDQFVGNGAAYQLGESDYNNYNISFPRYTIYVIYDDNGASGGAVPATESEYQYGSLTVSGNTGNLERTGFVFTGWNTDTDGTGVSYRAGDTLNLKMDDVTLYAQWTKVETYTVTYDANGGTGSQAVVTASFGSTHQVLSMNETGISRSNYTFTGWNTDADGNGTTYAAGASLLTSDTDVTLYAQWSKNSVFIYTDSTDSGTDTATDSGVEIADSDVPLTGSLPTEENGDEATVEIVDAETPLTNYPTIEENGDEATVEIADAETPLAEAPELEALPEDASDPELVLIADEDTPTGGSIPGEKLSSSTGQPKTGDTNALLLWSICFCSAVAALGALLLVGYRKKQR